MFPAVAPKTPKEPKTIQAMAAWLSTLDWALGLA
jgi:hypothetical protein